MWGSMASMRDRGAVVASSAYARVTWMVAQVAVQYGQVTMVLGRVAAPHIRVTIMLGRVAAQCLHVGGGPVVEAQDRAVYRSQLEARG